MGSVKSEWESFERQFLRVLADLQLQTGIVARLRAAVGTEASRAEGAELARDAARRSAGEARVEAAAAGAGAAQATGALARAHEDLTALRTQLEIAERERGGLEERCIKLVSQLTLSTGEVEQLRERCSVYAAQQAAFEDLQRRARKAADEAESSVQHLEVELRRVERSAGAGVELRERARLAAAAHVRERQLSDAELRHTTADLLAANAEIARLTLEVREARSALGKTSRGSGAPAQQSDAEWRASAGELRGALEAERAGAARLERALAALAADNAALSAAAAEARAAPGGAEPLPLSPGDGVRGPVVAYALPAISAVDSFLED